jgi:superfamily II DNA/RNA helicase
MTIDEADRILTIGYEFEMNEILKHLPTGTIQTTLFSATWNKRVHALTSKYLKPSAKYLLIGPSEKTLNRKITQLFEYINGFDKKLQALV